MNYITLKFNSSGVQQWMKTYGDAGEDHAIDLAFSSGSSPDVYITGYTTNTQGNKDITSVKYNNNGVLQTSWTQTNSSQDNVDDVPTTIKTDAYNNVLIAGYSGTLNAEDYTTIKYINNTFSPVITWVALNTFSATTGDAYQWYYNNNLMPGANQQTLNTSATGDGSYYCLVTQYCCSYKSNTLSVFVGTDDMPVTSFQIFPNPTNGNFKITYQLPINQSGNLEIFNTNGSCIYDLALPESSSFQLIKLPKNAEGLYYCVISSKNYRITKKVLVSMP